MKRMREWVSVCLLLAPLSAGARAGTVAAAERALEARAESAAPGPSVRMRGPESTDLREQLVSLLPGETLEDVARTLADRKVQVRLSADRAVVVVELPLR